MSLIWLDLYQDVPPNKQKKYTKEKYTNERYFNGGQDDGDLN